MKKQMAVAALAFFALTFSGMAQEKQKEEKKEKKECCSNKKGCHDKKGKGCSHDKKEEKKS